MQSSKTTPDKTVAFDDDSVAAAWTGCPDLREPLEALLRSTVDAVGGSYAPLLHRVVGAGGKRLRPALTLTVARLLGPAGGAPDTDASPATTTTPVALQLAAAVELLHTATLVHDDLIDGASSRRGTATINAREGIGPAVIAGDLLIGAASALAAQTGARAAAILSQTLVDLCQGEAAQDLLRFGSVVDVDQVLEVGRLKTGSLLRASCLLGAVVAGADDFAQAAVADFGEHFGISLQIVDDVLDVASTAELAGKPVGVDHLAGTVTLPSFFALRAFPDLQLLDAGPDELSRTRTLKLLRSPEALQPTVDLAFAHARRAAASMRAATNPSAGAERLASWPERFVRAQLETKIERRLQVALSGPAVLW